ncbi:MAG: hypothetical protein FWG25_11140 [Promicromonosporaceae bacterium]|nr:hypothetical protein [Promicromonosporaceae bacterium]
MRKLDGSFGSEIMSSSALNKNLHENALPEVLLNGTAANYQEFIRERSFLMAEKVKAFYHAQ